MKLTFYLFNESVKTFEEALNPKKTEGDRPEFIEVKLKDDLPFEGKAYFQQKKMTAPKWLSYISPYCELGNLDDIVNSINSFLLLIKVSNHFFAITAGFGFSAINRDNLETGFGLRTTLNAIDPNKIKSMDVRNIDVVTRQKRTFVNHDSRLDEFEFRIDDDLVNAISGQPKEISIGKKMSGSDSLSLTFDGNFPELGAKCELLLGVFLLQDYKKNFEFIDNVKQVKNKQVINTLDQKLYDALAERSKDKLTLAQPTIENEDQIETFEIKYKKDKKEVQEISIEAIYDFFLEYVDLEPDDPAEIDSRQVTILGFNHDGTPVTKKFTLYEYLVHETEYEGKTYILSLNKWYKVATDFIERVQNEINNIQILDYLSPIHLSESEGEYNERIAKDFPDDLVLLDRNLAPIVGRSTVEVCDLLWKERHFICVKKQTRSSTLSHLFAQGSVSATLLNDHREYREFIQSKVPQNWPEIVNVDNPNKSSITFVYAIATNYQGLLSDNLPFFSKVTLLNHKKTIERMGFKVAICKITQATT